MSRPAAANDRLVARIIDAYDGPVERAYCMVRFLILRQAFLSAIGAHIPSTGTVLDVGCGFGLFALYFAASRPGVEIVGFDLSERRVRMAQLAAERLGIGNVRFHVGDAATFRLDHPVAAAYMLDLIHHIPAPAVAGLLTSIACHLAPGGRLVIKDIEPSPAFKLAFTWLLDKVMDYRAPVRYWAPGEIEPLLASLDLDVVRRRLPDYLPYPHVLYVGTRAALEEPAV